MRSKPSMNHSSSLLRILIIAAFSIVPFAAIFTPLFFYTSLPLAWSIGVSLFSSVIIVSALYFCDNSYLRGQAGKEIEAEYIANPILPEYSDKRKETKHRGKRKVTKKKYLTTPGHLRRKKYLGRKTSSLATRKVAKQHVLTSKPHFL